MGGNDNVGGGYGSSGTGAAGGYDQDSYGSSGHTGAKPSAGDKIIGGLEKAAGKMTKNQGMAEKGADRATGGNY